MRKLKFAILFVLILCLTAAVFVACNPQGEGSDVGPIPTPTPGDPVIDDGQYTIQGADAWNMFVEAAKASNTDTGRHVYADTVIRLEYAKNAKGFAYALKVQADIDLENDANSQLLLELWEEDGEGNLSEMLLGLYYFESTLVYDCTGLKLGATAVKTENIDITAIERTLRELFAGSENEQYKSLAQFILNDLLSLNSDIGGIIVGAIPGLFGESRVTTDADGSQRIEMPIPLSGILGGALGGLLTPGPDGLIPEEVYDMVDSILGIDLSIFEALEEMNIYLVADLAPDDADGNRELEGVSVNIGLTFDTYGTSLEEALGVQHDTVEISIGGSGIQWNNDAPRLNVKNTLSERGIQVDKLQEYSLLTIDLKLSLNMVLKQMDITPNELMSAFGTLITGMLPEGDVAEQIAELLDKQIHIDGLDETLQLHISGGIDMFDNAGTNLLVEITGKDEYNDVRASIGYVGADETLYVDLSGILGTGKFYVDGINLNDILAGLFDDLVVMVQDALASAGLTSSEQADVDAFEDAVEEAISSGSVVRPVIANSAGEGISDTLGLIQAILDNIDVQMVENVFNIQSIRVALTEDILEYIWSLIFTGENAGATINIPGGIELEINDNGFASTKEILLDLALATAEDDVFAELGLGIAVQFGSVVNPDHFDAALARFSDEKADAQYIKLASLEQLTQMIGEDGSFKIDLDTLLANVNTLEIGLQADIAIDALAGEFADIKYEQANDFMVTVLAAFSESFSAAATLTVRAEVTDVAALVGMISGGGGMDIGALLSCLNVYVGLTEKGAAPDDVAPLRVWLSDSVLYLATSEDLLGGLALQVDIKPFLPASGQSEALTAEDTTGTGEGNTDTDTPPESVSIPPQVIALIMAADISLGDLYLDVALGSGLLGMLLDMLNVTNIQITDAVTGEELGLDAGVHIAFNDGLQLAGEDTTKGLSVGITLGVGSNFGIALTLGGINAAVNGQSNIQPDTSVTYVDFFNEPYANIALSLGLEADLKANNLSLGDGLGSITIPQNVNIDLELGLQAKLDLGSLLSSFTGKDPVGENQTELSLSLVSDPDGEREVLLAVYYAHGVLYVDASALIGARVSAEIDIMQLVAGLIAGSGTDTPGGASGQALTATDPVLKDNELSAFELLMYISSDGFILELAQGLAEEVTALIGMDIGEISAMLSLNWVNLVGDADGEANLIDFSIGMGTLADARVTLSPLEIGIGKADFDEVGTLLPEDVNAENFKSIGSLLNEEGALDLAGLTLNSVYAELGGTLELTANSDGTQSWTIGEWIDNFLQSSTTVSDDVKSFIQKLVLSFVINRTDSTSITFGLRALLRFPEDMSDTDAMLSYILSHSDIALEIKETGMAEDEYLLAVYLISDGNGGSDLYISSSDSEGDIIAGNVMVPGIDLGELISAGTSGQSVSGGDAVTTADCTAHADNDNDGACDNCGEKMSTEEETDILSSILSIINRIYMTDEELQVGLGSNFLASLINMLLPGYDLGENNFLQLDPSDSYLSLFYGKGEGEQRDIGIELSVGASPFTFALSLGGIGVAVNDDSKDVRPEGFDQSAYKNIFDRDGVVSLSTTLSLELSLLNTEKLPDGELPIGDMISAFGSALALELGVAIEDDLTIGVDVYLGANIYFTNPDATELALEIRDKNATTGDGIVLAVYLRGGNLYIDMGMLSEHNVMFENTGIVKTLLGYVNDALGTLDGASGTSEAVTAAEGTEDEGRVQDALEIILEAGDGHVALNVTEAVLLGIISAFANTDADIEGIFAALDLGADVNVDIDFERPALSVNVDTNYAAVGLSVVEPKVTNAVNQEVKTLIDGVERDGDFQKYDPETRSVARFELDLSVEYSADAQYIYVSDDDISGYPLSDRYTLLPDGSYVQDNDGNYVRSGSSLTDVLAAILEMPQIADALAGLGTDTLGEMVRMLVASLGIELYIDDPIADNLDIHIYGLLDLEQLGLTGLLGDFTLPTLDTRAILQALQVGLEIVFNPENAADNATIGAYLSDGYVYLDLTGIGGPKISADLFRILEELEVGIFAPGEGGSEAVTAANDTAGDGSGSVDVNAILNALVRAIVLRTNGDAALANGSFNIFENGVGVDLMLPADLLGNIVALITGSEEGYRFEDFVLSDDSKISLNVGGGDGVELVVSMRSRKDFSISVATRAGLVIDIATEDDQLLSAWDKGSYIDMTEMAFTVINLINGNTESGTSFGSQKVMLSVAGKATFESDGEGSYDVGTLLAQYLEDLVLEIQTDDAFSDGIGFRLSVAADLGKIGFSVLADSTLTSDEKLEKFLEQTDLNSIELALELLDVDVDGTILEDEVIAGIYLYNGYMYLDGTGVFDVVENYSYVPNFLRFVLDAVELGSSSGDNGGDPAPGPEPEPAPAGAYAQAMTAADTDTARRDALLELVYSNTGLQILLTKSLISAVLATLVPDLGSIADIFDNFEVSLAVDIGKYDYVDVAEAGLYKATANADGGAYAAVTEGGEIVGFLPYADGVEGDRYDLAPVTSADGTENTYYAKAEDGSFYRADARYDRYDEVQYVKSADGTGSYVMLDGEDTVLDRDRYTFYCQVSEDNYIVVTDITALEPDTVVYVRRGTGYFALQLDENGRVQTYDRMYGYVRDSYGTLYRVYDPYTALSEFYLTLGAHVGTMNVGLSLGGIQLEFGSNEPLVPSYIREGKTKAPAAYDGSQEKAYTYADGVYSKVEEPRVGEEYYYDVPLLPFYDSVITVGASVEIELSITEGQIDIGQIFGSILGNLDGLVIDIPSTNKGYSSAHLRLDLSLMLDMQNLPGSELAVRLINLSSESGAEVQWLAAYYLDEMLYIDLSFFNMPKVAVPMTEISVWIEEKLGDLLNASVYDDVEVGGGAQSEAVTAVDGVTPADTDEAADLTTEEKVAALLISNRKLSVSIGNALLRYLLSVITLGGSPIGDLIYDELMGGIDVTIDLSDGAEVALEVALALMGDRYEFYDSGVQSEGRYFVFVEASSTAAPPEGLFIYDEDEDEYREATTADIAEGGTFYNRYEAKQKEDGAWYYYKYTGSAEGGYVFDAEKDAYVAVTEADAGAERYAEQEISAAGIPRYAFVEGASANVNDYDTELDIYVGVNNLDLYFTEQREFSLTSEEMAQYYNFNMLDTVSLSETISLDLLFADGSDIDLSALFEYLFPDSSYDFDTIIGVVSGGDDEHLADIARGLNLTVSLEFKLGAFINYLRSLHATFPGGLLTDADGNPILLPERFDLVTFVQFVMGLIGKKDPADPTDDLFGLEDFLYFVNASVVLTTTSNDGTPEHTILGVYLSLGDNEGVQYDYSDPDHQGLQLYSHYYASDNGTYGYDSVAKKYMPISEINGYTEAEYGRYAYDGSYLYPDANGDIVREDAGLYVNLSYFGQPGVFINLTELIDFVNGMMAETEAGGDAPGASEAVTAAEGDGTSDEGGLSLPIDLGELLGTDISLDLPLLTEQIASYIRAFVFGARITSTYIRVLLQANFLNQLLVLLMDESPFGEDLEFRQSYIGINTDVNNYMYAPLVSKQSTSGEPLSAATAEQIAFADSRFAITVDENGMYYVKTDTLTGRQYFTLRSDMAEGETATAYFNIEAIETYINVDGEFKATAVATRTDMRRAERYTAADASAQSNPALIGTYKFYVDMAVNGDFGIGDATSGYAELDPTNVYVAYPDVYEKPFIEANVWLWDHSVSLGINMPTTSASEYLYDEVGERNGSYTRQGMFMYAPDAEIAGSGNDYLYYRGNYYQINRDALRILSDGSYNTVTDEQWNEFLDDPYGGSYFLYVQATAEGFRANIAVNATDVYEKEVYKYAYTYVGEGNGNYERRATVSLVSVPEFRADFNQPSDYILGEDDNKYHVDEMGNMVVGAAGPDNTYVRDDFTFVHSALTGRFTSVSDARANFLEMWADTYDTDGDGVVDEAMETEFNMNFVLYLCENFDVYGSDAGDLAGTPVFYDGDYIKYSDTGELYYVNAVIRGSISLSQYKSYLTYADWLLAGHSEEEWNRADKVVIENGEYVGYYGYGEEGKEVYGVYTASSSELQNVLGAILGDMDALFTVGDDYNAVLPFEIRATVMLAYGDAEAYRSLYVAGLELAIDLWRTEADQTLTHVLGLYYMSDPMNIDDFDADNDIINSAALYLDLSWIAGSSAKFKVDLSDYPLETLLNEKVLSTLLGGEGAGASEAMTAADGDELVSVGNPDKATVLLNVMSRKLVLQASAGFLKLVIDLIAPQMTATLEEMLPNLSVNATIGLAPYDITIGATLFDNEGCGLLDLGITLNLFNTVEKTDGLQLDFGSPEEYDEVSAARLEARSKEFMYYYGMFSRVDEDYVRANPNAYYYTKGDAGEKAYQVAELTYQTEEEKLAQLIAYANDNNLFIFNDEPGYQALVSQDARAATPDEQLYAAVPAGYVMLRDKEDYAWATATTSGNKLTLYHYRYRFRTDGTGYATMQRVDDIYNTPYSEELYPYVDGPLNGHAKLYVSYSEAVKRDGADAVNSRFGVTAESVNTVRYELDSNGAHKQSTVLTNYQTLLALDLGTLLNAEEGTEIDVVGLIVDGLTAAGLQTVEIGGTLSIDLTFDDALNWTRQMSRLMEVDGREDNYFAMMLASMAMNSAELVSKIGLDISLALQINVSGLIEMLPTLMNMPEGESVDIASLLPSILKGAKIYMEIAIDTNFYGDDISDADPIQLWIDVTDDLFLNVYLTAPDLGRVTDISNEEAGDFFAQGIKIENLINLGSLLSSIGTGEAGSEAVTAADDTTSGGGLIIDIGTASTGLLPENIWGVLDLILGQALFAQDMISVGITENLLAGIIEVLVPEFPEDDLALLPTFTVTSDSSTSGVNLLFGGGSVGLQLQLGVRGGFDDFATIEEATTALKDLIGAENSNIYGIDSYDAYFAKIAYLNAETNGDDTVYAPVEGTSAVNAGGDAVVISTEDYGLAAYASPEVPWLGDRYELVDFDEDGHPVFGSWDRDENGDFETDADGTRTYTLDPVDKDVAYKNAFSLNTAGTGLYGRLPVESEDYQGIVGGQVSDPNNLYIVYEQYAYMLVSNIEKLLGEEYDADTYGTYDFCEDNVTGAYAKLGDVTIAVELNDISLSVNNAFSAPTTDANGLNIYDDYTDVTKAKIRLSTAVDIGFWGNNGADINLGSLADLIFGIDALKQALGVELVNSDLDVSVTGDFGSQEEAYFTVVLDGYLDLATSPYDLQVKLEVKRVGEDEPLLAVYLVDDNVYANLAGLLGQGVQGSILHLGLTDMLSEALGGVLGGGAASSDAMTAAISDTAGMINHNYAYLGVMINPGYFSLQLTLAAIEAIIAKVSADNPDLALGDLELPDLGDIKIESYGDRNKGDLLSLSVKMSEDFGASIDVKHLAIGVNKVFSDAEIAEFENNYPWLYDISMSKINPDLNISASAKANIAMTSEGLDSSSEDYDESLAGWVIDLLTNLLGANSFFVSSFSTADKDYINYEGPLYEARESENNDGTVTYVQVGTTVKDNTSQYKDMEGNLVSYAGKTLYRTTMIEATFAASQVNLTIDLEADLNIGALVAAGIGGILLSDLRLSVGLGDPFNTTILEVYYLGSSRLNDTANGSIYELKEAIKTGKLGAFSDAIYIDATGLGLGKIKFQGIAGLLGANIGSIYEGITASDASSAADETGTDDTTGGEEETLPSASVSLGINVAENYLGINIDRSLIQMVFDKLMPTLAKAGIASLPDVQSLNLGLTFGDFGLDTLTLSTVVDGAGTGLNLSLSDFEISLDKLVDTDDLVSRVATQFAGATYSKTAGVKTLLQSLIDSIDPNLSINVDRRAYSVVLDTSGDNYFGVGRDLKAVRTTTNSSLTLVSSYGYQQDGGDGFTLVDVLGGGTTLNDYAIKLDLTANHPDASKDQAITAKVYFGNNNLMIADVNIGLGWASGLADMAKIFNWINLGTVIGGGQLFPSFAYGDDRDTATWNQSTPVAVTAGEGEAGVAADGTVLYGNELKKNGDGSVVTDNDTLDKNAFTTRGSAATNVNGPYKWAISDDGKSWTSGYSYGGGDIMSILNGLVNRVEVNLFNKNGYQPYLATMPDHRGEGVADTDSSLISVKVELNKDAYNELMIFLYTFILSLLHVAIDANGAMTWNIDGNNLSTGVAEHEGGKEFYYFAYDTNWMMGGSRENEFGNIIRRHENISGNSKWVMSNLFAELDSIDYMNISEHEKTVRRVQLLEPYARAIPSALLNWVLRDLFHLSAFLAGLLGDARQGLGDATTLISSLLPTFASYDSDAPNPSLNIYIDLDPSARFYGLDGSVEGYSARDIAPGIQAIELMVNVEKDGGQRLLAGINDSGSPIYGQNLFNTSKDANGTLKEAYVLSINPRNLVASDAGYSGEGLFELLQADRLAKGEKLQTIGGVDVDRLSIEVSDVGTKQATVKAGNSSIASGTLNADLLTSVLPTTAEVELVGYPSTNAHSVPVVWDAGAIDYSPAERGETRLAGFVYGYALNLVVAKIPVYITGTQSLQEVRNFSSAPAGTGDKLQLTLDGSGEAELPELVYLRFASGGGVFGTQYHDATGAAMYAVKRTGAGQYEKNASGAYNVYPAYTALLVDDDRNGAPDTVRLDGTDYYIIEPVKYEHTDGTVETTMPIGTFSWDTGLLDFNWDGGSVYEDGASVTVGISYQWGFSATQTAEIELPISTAEIRGSGSGVTFRGASGEVRNFQFRSWSDFATKIGTSSVEELEANLKDYFAGFSEITGGRYFTPTGSQTGSIGTFPVAWDVSALYEAVTSAPGSAVSVDVTMYVQGFKVWREYEKVAGTDGAEQLSLVHGLMSDVAINYGGEWVIATAQEHHAQIVNSMGGALSGVATVAQPVTVTVTISSQNGFQWTAAPVTGGEENAPAPDTFAFADGTSTSVVGGVQTYSLTTSDQVFGALPESGSVVDGATGKTRKATFDWNGFVYDTTRASDVAELTVTSGGERADVPVLVTLADNSDVDAAADVLNNANTGSPVKKIVDARYRALAIDPFRYSTFGEYLAGEGLENASIRVVTEDGRTIAVTVTSWSDTLTADTALPFTGARYIANVATMQDGEGNVYTAVVPVIINARTIESTEILLNGNFKYVGSSDRFSNTVRRYNGPGQVIEISYDRDSHLPTAVTVYNTLAFADENPFVLSDEDVMPKIAVTFAEGGSVKVYDFSLAELVIPTTSAQATTASYAYELTYESGKGAALSGSLEFTFSELRVNANNLDSAIASGDLGGMTANMMKFAPYDNMIPKDGDTPLPTPYGTDGKTLDTFVADNAEAGDVTVYIGGMFVQKILADRYTSTAEGADAPRYTQLADRTYNASASGNSYTLADGDTGAYVYVYSASYLIKGSELTWKHSDISYNYNGGYKRTTVTINHKYSETASVTGTITMPISIASGRITDVVFQSAGASEKDYSAYFNAKNTAGIEYFNAHFDGKKLVFDPFEGLDIDAFAKVENEAGELVNAAYYLYFPERVGFVTASGATVEMRDVTWSNLANIRNTYRGGEFGARLTVPAVTSADGKTTYVSAQGYTISAFVKIENREVIEGTDSSSFGLQAEMADGSAPFMTATNPLSVGWADRAGLGTGTFIDPYSFDIAAFRAAAESITTVKVMVNGISEPVYYGTNGIGGVDKATQGYTLAWSFTGMSVSYLGGRVALIAQLTGPDGSMQEYEIDYLVTRKVVGKLESTKGGNFDYSIGETFDCNITSDPEDANFGRSERTYTIDPYKPRSHSMPTGWKVTFKVSDPVFDVTTGEVTGWTAKADQVVKYSYIAVTMPTSAAVTVKNATDGLQQGGDATMQIEGGQRIRIPVSINAAKYTSGFTSPANDTRTLSGSVNGIIIVWHGSVRVWYNNNASYVDYEVTLVDPSGGNVTVPTIKGLNAKYTLTPYIGAVVDAAGVVLQWNADGTPASQATGTQITVTIEDKQ